LRVTLRRSLFAGFVAIIGILVVVASLSLRRDLREDLLRNFRSDIERSLRLAELVMVDTRLEPALLAPALSERIGMRVTLVARDGTVVGESNVRPADLPVMENHGERPEVRGAWTGERTVVERRSGTLGVPMLYAAAPVELGDRDLVLRIAAPLERIDEVIRRAQRDLNFATALALVVAFLITALLGRWVSRPLGLMSERSRAFASGDLAARMPRDARLAELDDLAHDLNRVADELEARVRELARERDEMRSLTDSIAEGVIALTSDARVLRINQAAIELLDVPRPLPFAPVGTLVRNPELRELLEASVFGPPGSREIALGDRRLLISSRPMERGAVLTFLDVSELRRVERVRRDFVANASHELKTPLTAMRGFAEALLEEEPPEEMRRQFVASIHQNTLRMQKLVDDLLDLSRLEAGAWSHAAEAVDPARLVREVWEELAGGRDGPRLRIEGEAELVADRGALVRIFRNLLENSLRYTGEDGTIGVEIGERSGVVQVAVRDDGAGIPSDALPRIFERFYRADPARARAAGGTGLGLAIVRHLVTSMGGAVEAESELGVGTTIRFHLPNRPPVSGRNPEGAEVAGNDVRETPL
jgi:two-component system, OmpR family, phosphate regulon sensor histidine kinase PhoR